MPLYHHAAVATCQDSIMYQVTAAVVDLVELILGEIYE